MEKIKLSGIIRESIVDGPGIRFVVFTQGCPHKCKGCHNPQTHDFDGGKYTYIDKIIGEIVKNPLLSGVTISGGEPFSQTDELLVLCKKIKELNLSLMIYSGYTYEELVKMGKKNNAIIGILKLIDILVDGKFIEQEKSLNLEFRGSKNQRLLYFQKGVLVEK